VRYNIHTYILIRLGNRSAGQIDTTPLHYTAFKVKFVLQINTSTFTMLMFVDRWMYSIQLIFN
jgi:hypothetical protein